MGIKGSVLATPTPLEGKYTDPPILRSPDCVVTSESTGGGGSYRVFWGDPNKFGVLEKFAPKFCETTIKIVFSDPKIGGNVTLVQNFTLGMTLPQNGDVLGSSYKGALWK